MTKRGIIALVRNEFKDANLDERNTFLREVFEQEYIDEKATKTSERRNQMKETNNSPIEDRLTKILSSLEKQQNELWNKDAFANVSGNDLWDFKTRNNRKHVVQWTKDISKMRMLELLLKRLFETNDDDDEISEDFDKFVRESASLYMKLL